DAIAHSLAAAGADAHVAGDVQQLAAFAEHGAAQGHPSTELVEEEGPRKPRALVYDATGVEHPRELKQVYAFFQAHLRSLDRCGRVVVLARPAAEGRDPFAASASQALEGFVRSVAKEIGRKGATAQILFVGRGAEQRCEPALRWLLSERSAYVDGQPLTVSAAVAPPAEQPFTRPLDGKVAMVTGAAQGIGAETARTLAREGARLIVVDHPSQEAPAAKIADELGAALLLADVTDAGTPQAIDELVDERFGGALDVVIHNAGVTRDKMLVNMPEDRWDMVLGVNLLALMAMDEVLVPKLRTGGRMVYLASIAGIAGNTGQTNYAASKAGVIGYVRALAPTVASRGIAVNAVAPGFIETRMTARIPFATREAGRRLCALSQGGLPSDVAETITFLSSPGAAGLSGQVLRICGGMLLGA
ncbi:MAG: 3-oxoacyl-ACP reductase, partial [Myxococcota bacterium]|nr:3-oxoacyl-ACP reductase [Myxococcota bacterium]